MSSVSIINTLVSQIQYLFLLLKQNITLPEQISVVRSYLLILFNLDWATVESYLPSYLDWVFSIRFDFRVQYIVVVGLLPLLFSSFLLLQYLDAFGVASFFLAVAGTFSLVSGLFGDTESSEIYYIIAGAVMLLIAAGLGLVSSSGAFIRTIISSLFSLIARKPTNQINNLDKTLSTDETKKSNVTFKEKILELIRYGLSGIILIVSGVLFTGVVRISWLIGYNGVESAIFDSNFTWLFYVLSGFLVIEGIVHLVAFIILIIPSGSTLLNGLKSFIQAITLKLSFLILSLIFTPIIATLVTSFHCKDYACPAGTFHRDRYLSDWKRNLPSNLTQVSPLYSTYLSLSNAEKSTVSSFIGNIPENERELEKHWIYDPTICYACTFYSDADKTCGNSRTTPFTVCPAKDVSVLRTDVTVGCGTMRNYYVWGSGVLLVFWCIGVPLLVLLLIIIAIRYSEEINVEEIRTMEKTKKNIFDKIDDKMDAFWDKFWNIVLLKKYWPKALKKIEESRYNVIYLPILKLADLFVLLLYQITRFENIIYAKQFKIAQKGVLLDVAKAATAIRNAMKNSLSKDAAEIWFLRVGLLKNNLQHLYCNFEFRTRFFYLWELILKIVLTIIASALINYPQISISIMTLTHLIIVLGWLFVQPYLNFIEDILSFILAAITLINHIYALINLFFTPPWWLYFLLIFNILSPILSVITAFIFFFTRSSKNSIKKSDERYKLLKENVEKADKDITRVSVKLINSFFFTIAIITVIALGFCFVGLSKDVPYLIPAYSSGTYTVRSCETLKKLQFSTHETWSNFATSCCCHEDPFYKDKVYDMKTKDYQLVEIWHCPQSNGEYYKKLRVREIIIDGVKKSGLYLRPFCSKTFTTGVTLDTTCSTSTTEYTYSANYAVGDEVFFNHPIISWTNGKIVHIETNRYQTLYHCAILNSNNEIDLEKNINEVTKLQHHDIYPTKQDKFGEEQDLSANSLNNLLDLIDLHESTLLHTIQDRFNHDEIYTMMGQGMILSINPFKWTIPWVQESEMERYMKQEPGLKPSCWTIADDAFRDMIEKKNNHSILISGISGAGKTEACKSVIRYLNKLSLTVSMTPSEVECASKISSMIEASSPILEAFGNAKTVNNDNSSRFGKFIKLLYSNNSILLGAHIENYLLETSRLIRPGKNERTYHIFYQLLCPDDDYESSNANIPTYPSKKEIISLLYLDGYNSKDFPYINYGNCTIVDSIDDKIDFRNVMLAFNILEFSLTEVITIFKILGAILHLQLVQIDEKNDKAEINGDISNKNSSLYHLDKASILLGLDRDKLKYGFITKTIQVPKSAPIISPINQSVANDARDAFIKHIYSNTFNWIISKTNQKITPSTSNQGNFIGILDIFGFELFQLNSFEQFCINFANESLQLHYNDHNFKNDMEDCKKEGIDVTSVKFNDNSPCITLISGSKTEGNGILDILDDQCNFPKATDNTFLNTIISQFYEKKPDFLLNKAKQNSEFIINHYSARVDYNVSMWLEKNRDRLKEDLIELTRNSTEPFVASLIPEPIKIRGKNLTVGGHFKIQLNSLLNMINQTKPAWIRCIKSHSIKKPSRFHRGEVIDQLRSSGVLETVKMRREGFSVRIPLQQFWSKYRFLVNSGVTSTNVDISKKCQLILDSAELNKTQAQVGKTKVFIRTSAYPLLNQLRTKCLLNAAHTLQNISRMRLAISQIELIIYEREREKREAEERELRRIREEQEKIERELREEQERRKKEEEERLKILKEEQERLEKLAQEEQERIRKEEEEIRRKAIEQQEKIEKERKEASERLKLEREERERQRLERLEEEKKKHKEMEEIRKKLLEEAKQRQLEEEKKYKEQLEKEKKEAEEEKKRKEEEIRIKHEKIEKERKKAEAAAQEKRRLEAIKIAALKAERLLEIQRQREIEEQERIEDELRFQEERDRLVEEEKERFKIHLEKQRKAYEMSSYNRQKELVQIKKKQNRNKERVKMKLELDKLEREKLKKYLRNVNEYDKLLEASILVKTAGYQPVEQHSPSKSPNEKQIESSPNVAKSPDSPNVILNSESFNKKIQQSPLLSPTYFTKKTISPIASYRPSQSSNTSPHSPRSSYSPQPIHSPLSPRGNTQTKSAYTTSFISIRGLDHLKTNSQTINLNETNDASSSRIESNNPFNIPTAQLRKKKDNTLRVSNNIIRKGMFSSETILSKIKRQQ